MKNFLKKIAVFCGIIVAISFTTNLTTASSASAFSCRNFLGMTSWDCNVSDNISSENDLISNITTIASNILTDITVIASYLVIGYVMWGGYQYMFSSGDPGKAASGRKTLTNAFIGLGITISAYTIFGAIRVAMIGSKNLGACDALSATPCTTPDTMIINIIQWVAGMGGVVAAIFIIIGGWGYMTSAGDPGKLQKAKTTIAYALIGLVIVAATEVITAFVSSTIRDANAFTTNTVVAKNTADQLSPYTTTNINKELSHENI